MLEVEKIDVLTKYYDDKIEKELAKKDENKDAVDTKPAADVSQSAK